MKSVKIGNKEYIFIEVPDDAHTFRKKLSYEGGYWLAMFEPRILPYLAIQSVRIEGNSFCKFKIITTTNTITEEIAEDIVLCTDEKSHKLFGDSKFKNYFSEYPYYHKTALESFYSLMDSLELDRSKNYLLIEKL